MNTLIYKAAAILALSSGLIYGIYDFGYDKATEKCQEERYELLLQHAAEMQQRLAEIRELEADWLAEEKQIEIRTVVREKKVIEYVEKNGNSECLDTDGIELFNEITSSGLPRGS